MKWSLSQWGTFNKCRFLYDCKYNKRLPEQQNVYSARGSENHRVIEQFLKDKTIPNLPQSMVMYETFLRGLRDSDSIVEPEVVLALNDKWEPVHPTDTDRWWKGVLDLLLRRVGSSTGTMFDWKTGKIYDDHHEENELYCVATLAHFPDLQEVCGTYVYLDLGKNRPLTVHRDQMPGVQEKWNNRVRQMEACTDFIPNPTYRCNYCSFSSKKGGPCRF